MLTIRHYPDPVLRKVAKPVEAIGKEISDLANAMMESMYADKGVGLAATQVGVDKRVIIVDLDPENHDPQVLVNPVITSKSKEKETAEEGCLSVPGISAKVTRPAQVTVEALDLAGNTVEYSGGGLLARALQHEIDHLDGILFIDKLSIAAKFSIRDELARLESALSSSKEND